jgi:tetratricopeptide (TPR) repeat protein
MASSIRITCSNCKTEYHLDPGAQAGWRVACRNCGELIAVPRSLGVPEAEKGTGTFWAKPPSGLSGKTYLSPFPRPPGPAALPVPAPGDVTVAVENAPDRAAAVALPAPPSLSDRYVEEGVIARGGMGEIVLCVDRGLRREVAMKRILPADARDPRRRMRFVEEAQVTGQLEHPNIVPVHDLAADGEGAVYFTMKLVRGRALGEILDAVRRGDASPTLPELLRIFLKVCDGVAFAHSRGVIHRDLKPDNIMVGDFGEVLVMDWGLAKILGCGDAPTPEGVRSSRSDSSTTLTEGGSPLGTPAYMPPEQAEGRLEEIDQRSDVYSLGGILHEILTLARPSGAVTRTLRPGVAMPAAPRERPSPLRRVPRELLAIASKCLAEAREERYQGVPELAADVVRFLEGRSVSACPDTALRRLVKLLKRHRAVSAAIVAAAAILLVMGILFAFDNAAKRRTAERALTQQRATALAASEAAALQAVRAAEEGRFGEADLRAEAATQLLPDGPWGPYAQGVVAFEARDLPGARKHLEEALGRDPSHEPSRAYLARILAAAGQLERWEEVLADPSKANDWRSLHAVGDALMSAGRHERAHEAYRRARALMEGQGGVPARMRAEVEDDLGRAEACLKTRDLPVWLRRLPPKEQPVRLEATLREVYGDGIRIELIMEGSVVTGLILGGDKGTVRWLDPLRGLPLTFLDCSRTQVSDLGPLKGMPLLHLDCSATRASDLRPLVGMPLKSLACELTRVSDLNPLKDMSLTSLNIGGTHVGDLAPLRGMPLTTLRCGRTRVSDLGPLKGMPLALLRCGSTRVSDLGPLAGLPLRHLNCANAPVRELAPLEGMALESLFLHGTEATDLTPLAGMPLRELSPPPGSQLTPESAKLIESLRKQGCRILSSD